MTERKDVLSLFKNPKPIIGVIHCKGGTDAEVLERAKKEIDIYERCGVDGVLVETYFGTYHQVEKVLSYLQSEKSHYPYGVNCLNVDAMGFILAETYGCKYLQIDSVGGHLKPRDDESLDAFFHYFRKDCSAALLGGVRFKYQPVLSGRSVEEDLAICMNRCAAVDKLHSDNPEKKKRALKRGLEFMAITPQLSTLLMGINAAMEEENANNPDFDENTINSVKTSLMGPLAGIGDSLIPGTLRIIAAGIAISLAMSGNIAAPILYLLIFNIPAFLIRYFCLKYGYKFGTGFLTTVEKTGIMDKVSYGASIVGLMVIGGMIAGQIWLDLPIMVGSGDFATPLTDYFDQIMPCLIPLGCFGAMYYLLGKKVKTTTILIGLIIVCVAVCGIAALF